MFQLMPPAKRYNQVVKNHIMNHKVPRGTRTAVFVFTPAHINSAMCPIASMIRSNVNIELRGYPYRRRRDPSIFVTSWSIQAELVTEALQSIQSHIYRADFASINVIILFYAHACSGFLEFGDCQVSIHEMVRTCNRIPGLRVLGLLGCHTASANLPNPSGYVVFGFRGEVDFNSLSRFAAAFVDYFCDIEYMRKFSYSLCIALALRASYNVFIQHPDVIKFE